MSLLLSREDFEGKSVFVAGGSSGINLGIAETFAMQGARVAICSRSEERVKGAVEELRRHGGEVFGTTADVRDYAQVEEALKAAKGAHGEFDVVISGAAGNFVAPALGMSANGFKTVVDIDLLGTFNVLRASFDHLNTPGASLINITAPQGSNPYALQSHVCAAKAGIDMLTRTLAIEWGPLGVRVNAISPGPIEGTEGMERLAPDEKSRAEVTKGVPLRRWGTKYEIGQACLWLASPMAAYVTGVILPVDGGMIQMGGGLGESVEAAFEQAAKAAKK